MPEKVYTLNVPQGIKRDGTNFETGEFTDGKWSRFQRGKPRKVGGYRAMNADPNVGNIPRGMKAQSTNGINYTFVGHKAGINVHTNSNDNGIASLPYSATIGSEYYSVAVLAATAANTLTFSGDQTASGSNLFSSGSSFRIWSSTTKAYTSYTVGSATYSVANAITTVITSSTPTISFLTSLPPIAIVIKSARFTSTNTDTYSWNFAINYSPSGGAYSVAAMGLQNLVSIDSRDKGQLYVGNILPTYTGGWAVEGTLIGAIAVGASAFYVTGDQRTTFTKGLNIAFNSSGSTPNYVVSSSSRSYLTQALSQSIVSGISYFTVPGDLTKTFPVGTYVSFDYSNVTSGYESLYIIVAVLYNSATATTTVTIGSPFKGSYLESTTTVYVQQTAVYLTSATTAAVSSGTTVYGYETVQGLPQWSFTAISDTSGSNPTGVPIKADGGVCSLYPFLFVYGSDGYIANNHVASYTSSSTSTTSTTSYVATGTLSSATTVGGTTIVLSGNQTANYPAGTVLSFAANGSITYTTVGTPVFSTNTTITITPAVQQVFAVGTTVYKQTVTSTTTTTGGGYSTNTFTDWNGPLANQVNVTSGKILKGMPVRGGTNSPSGLFWATNALIRVSFTGTAPLYWSNDIISTDCSCMSGNSVVEQDGVYYWMGTDRFYLYNGTVQVLPNDKNLNYLFDNLNYTQRSKVWGVSIKRYNEIWWFYPRGLSNECNDVIVYNTKEKIWFDLGQAPGCRRSCGVASALFPNPIFAGWDYETITGSVIPLYSAPSTAQIQTASFSLEYGPNLIGSYLTIYDPYLPASQQAFQQPVQKIIGNSTYQIGSINYTTLSISPGFIASPVSATQTIVKQLIGGYNIWQHDFGVDKVLYTDITAVESSIETSDIGFINGDPSRDTDVVGTNRRMKIIRVEPDFIQSGPMTLEIKGRAYPSDEDTTTDQYLFTPETQKIDIRKEFRIVRLKFTSNIEGGDYQLGRPLIQAEPGDERA